MGCGTVYVSRMVILLYNFYWIHLMLTLLLFCNCSTKRLISIDPNVLLLFYYTLVIDSSNRLYTSTQTIYVWSCYFFVGGGVVEGVCRKKKD